MSDYYEIIEDNGGGLHIFVFENDHVVDGVTGLEYAGKGEFNEVKDGLADDPAKEVKGWDGHFSAAKYDYLDLTSHDGGWVVIANTDAVYPGAMGRAGQRYFGIDAE